MKKTVMKKIAIKKVSIIARCLVNTKIFTDMSEAESSIEKIFNDSYSEHSFDEWNTEVWTSSPPSGFTSRYAERARLPHTLHTQAIHALSVHTLIAALPRPERRGLRSMLLDQN